MGCGHTAFFIHLDVRQAFYRLALKLAANLHKCASALKSVKRKVLMALVKNGVAINIFATMKMVPRSCIQRSRFVCVTLPLPVITI